MRGPRNIAGWLAVSALMLFAAVTARAQGAGAAPPPPIVLGAEWQRLPLDSHALYFIDEARHPTPEALEAAGNVQWRVREPRASYRIDGKALWFRFDAINPGSVRWFLELGASGVDRTQFFWRGPDGQWVSQEAGDTRPDPEWPIPGRLPTFELAGRTEQSVRYWLRIEQARVDFAAPMVLHDQSSLLASRENEQFLLGGFFSLAALIALLSFANAIAFRDRNFGVYGVYVVALAAGQLAYLGIGAQHVWPYMLGWNSVASFVLPGISAAAALWFTRTVTEPQRYSRALDLAVWATIAALLSAVALDIVLESRASFTLVISLATFALLVVALLIAVVWAQGEDPTVRLVALGFLPVLVAAVFPILRGFNVIPVSPITRYAISFGAALEMPILFYAISVRGSRRREAAVRAAGLSRTDTLTSLAHTRTLLQRLDGSLQRCATLKHTCVLMAVKIANYETILAEYGRDAAERALVVAASLLRNVSGDVDIPARVGDQHFALLIDGPATAIDAANRAQRLVASGLRPSDSLPTGLLIKFHVAAAMLPEQKLDADASLDWLLDAVNAMRAEDRKLIRPLNF